MCSMTVRKSVVLDDEEQAALAELTEPSDEMRETLAGWAQAHGVTLSRSSESAVLRALIKVGLASLREARLEAGYRALAATATETDHAESRVAREWHVSRLPAE